MHLLSTLARLKNLCELFNNKNHCKLGINVILIFFKVVIAYMLRIAMKEDMIVAEQFDENNATFRIVRQEQRIIIEQLHLI